MAASDTSLLAKLARQGYEAIQPAAGLGALRSAVAMQSIAGISNVIASPFVWPTFLKGQGFPDCEASTVLCEEDMWYSKPLVDWSHSSMSDVTCHLLVYNEQKTCHLRGI